MIKLKINTILENFKERSACRLCEKEFKIANEKENAVVKEHCHLASKIRGKAHDKIILGTQKKYVSIVPNFCYKFSENDCHLIFEKLINIAFEKVLE